jgi:hypothetical protein
VNLALVNKRIQWQRFAKADLREIKDRAAKKLAKIEANQAKEYQELFPSTCSRIEIAQQRRVPVVHQGISTELLQGWSVQSDVHPEVMKLLPFQKTTVQGVRTKRGCWRFPLGRRGLDMVQVSCHRGPPTDRPPDKPPPVGILLSTSPAGVKPPPCKGASRGCLQERAGARHVSQLASFTRGSYGLSGNATPLQTMQFNSAVTTFSWCCLEFV